MQIPNSYGYVVLAVGAMAIPNVVAVVQIIKARKKYGVKYPDLYAPDVRLARVVRYEDDVKFFPRRRLRVFCLFVSLSLCALSVLARVSLCDFSLAHLSHLSFLLTRASLSFFLLLSLSRDSIEKTGT